METNEEKTVKAIAKIIQLTQMGKIVWQKIPRFRDNIQIVVAYRTQYVGNTIVIYKQRINDTFFGKIINNIEPNPLTDFIKGLVINYLEFVDDKDLTALWEVPRLQIVDD